MADNTNRFGLNTYSQGDTNWDHTDTVQTIDELAIERGAAADRPDSGDYDDELYLATDQQILYRWDADATDWIVEGVGSETDPLPKVWANEIDANSVSTDSLDRGDGDLIAENEAYSSGGVFIPVEEPQDTSSSTEDSIADMGGAMPLDNIPDGATLYGFFAGRTNTVPSGETATYNPRLVAVEGSNTETNSFNELEIEMTSDDEFNTSGWQEITTIEPTDWEILTGASLRARVTDGTLESGLQIRFAVVFEWRVD